MPVGRREALFVAFALAGCVPESRHEVVRITSDDYLVAELVHGVADELTEGRTASILARLDPAFLHEGEDAPRVEAWIRYHLEAFPGATVLADDVELSVEGGPAGLADEGALAEVSYTLRFVRCPDGTAPEETQSCPVLTETRYVPGGPQAWLSHVVKRGGAWVPVGDGRPVGLSITTLHDGARYLLRPSILDPRAIVRGATLSGPTLASPVALAPSAAGAWEPAAELELAASIASLPALPALFTFAIETTDGPLEEEATVRAVVDEFATSLVPDGEVAPPLRFGWESPADRFRRYVVAVSLEGTRLWVSPSVVAPPVAWAGPALEPGRSYDWELRVRDSFGNESVARASFVPIDEQAQTPVVETVSPVAGPAAGGQLVELTGANFTAGSRVLFGAEEAGEPTVVDDARLTCRTPPGTAGVVNVTVIEPGGRVGLLERAYTYE